MIHGNKDKRDIAQQFSIMELRIERGIKYYQKLNIEKCH